ncbi:hypothetical protein [Methylotuvimicrobium sp. KM2]|uniref:hypothetical protein n=1 Tax=Methylotuvimicrobium sp. KM2 TaxID=3133976 RepID=UPI00310128DF
MLRVRCLLLPILWLAFPCWAEPLKPERIPEPLKPWIDWVLHDDTERGCPFLYNSFEQKRCAWPSQLDLALSRTEGRFSIIWQAYRESWVNLPGHDKQWPLNVTANGKPLLVTEKKGRPSVFLEPGTYTIEGAFAWDKLPENLTVPQDTGLITLSINGQFIDRPNLKRGQLWLTRTDDSPVKPDERNSLEIQIFRQLIDDIPMQVLTRLDLNVSGEQREVKFAYPMLEDFLPLRIDSPLPARLEPDGQLLVQVRPGRWQLDIMARSTEALNTIPFSEPLSDQSKDWSKSELWVFDARPSLRVVEVERPAAIDPTQTNLPENWKRFPAYAIQPGESLVLKTIRRGDPDGEPNNLNLTRTLWLDFDGKGYTVNDKITGTLSQGWRLDALPRTELGRVSLDGANQLITRAPDGQSRGVEVRKGAIRLDADSRISGSRGSLNAVGWAQSFHQVRAELNLPPGWRLLAAGGVDNVPDSWLSHWTLLDLFLVLIASLAALRLWNVYHGGLTLLTLVLIWHEPGAPQWVWLNILAAAALLKVLPEGKFRSVVGAYRSAAWAVLVLIAIPFMVDQVRIGLYPQLEKPWQPIQGPRYERPVAGAMPETADELMMMEAPSLDAVRKKARSAAGIVSQAVPSAAPQKRLSERTDPNAKIQTGPGLPQWQWQKINLSWNGSVTPDQQISLWYLSPFVTMLLNFLRVGLIALLAIAMLERLPKHFKFNRSTASLLILMGLPILMMPNAPVQAAFPDPVLLDELKNRLQKAPDCVPNCAGISLMQLTISDKELTIDLEVHAQDSVAVPLPGHYEHWYPNTVSIDGEPAKTLYSSNNGLWLALDAGLHRVVMKGAAPPLAKFTVPLPLKPKRAELSVSDWQVFGVHENGLTDDQLQFSRIAQTEVVTEKAAFDPGILPPFVRIERTLQLGLDWRVETRIVRVSPSGSSIVLAVPLLDGESVITGGVRVEKGSALVNMSATQNVMHWESVLKKSDRIEFTASATDQWVEIWRADVSPVWHIETAGIAMMHQDKRGYWLPEWRPWPGEQVVLTVSRPEPAPGQTLTIESSRLNLTPGSRSRNAQLELALDSSLAAQHTIRLPEQAVLEAVTINGQSRPIRQKEREVVLPIDPGKHQVVVSWQESVPMSSVLESPQVDLALPSVNSNLHLTLGEDRWVLMTMGPRFGPAVLIWGVLVVIVIVSFGLGKVTLTPLKTRHWLLLLIGLSQIPVLSALIVVLWLIALGLRKERPAQSTKTFNAAQVGLGLLTLLSLMLLFWAVEQGLLGSPDMQITGNQSSAYRLNWYQDRSDELLPTATVVSVPLMVYRLLMLAWSLWLAVALLNWLKWGWTCFSSNGLWKRDIVKLESPLDSGHREEKNQL